MFRFMRSFGYLLIALGAIGMGAGYMQSMSELGADTTNLGLIADRLAMIIIGGALFVGGAVLSLAPAPVKPAANTAPASQPASLQLSE